jgi:hypothetical protein
VSASLATRREKVICVPSGDQLGDSAESLPVGSV